MLNALRNRDQQVHEQNISCIKDQKEYEENLQQHAAKNLELKQRNAQLEYVDHTSNLSLTLNRIQIQGAEQEVALKAKEIESVIIELSRSQTK